MQERRQLRQEEVRAPKKWLRWWGCALSGLTLIGAGGLPGVGSAQERGSVEEDATAHEREKLLDILRNAKEPPTPQIPQTGAPESGDSLGVVEYNLKTKKQKVTPRGGGEPESQPALPSPPDLPFDGTGPVSLEAIEGIGGAEHSKSLVVGPLNPATPPSPVYNSLAYPFNTVFKLLMRFNVGGIDYYYVCSASSTGSFHLLTAGHCLYNWDPNDDGNTSDARWASEVWAWAAQTDQINPFGVADQPYGEAKAVYLRSYTGWTVSGDFNHDWGVITLNRRDGDHTGWMGRETATTSSLNFTGYPTETPYVPAGTLVQYFGYDANNVLGYTCCRIQLDALIYGGHSGGPSWRFDGANRWIQGLHSTSNRVGYAEDTYLTNGKRTDLNSWMSTDETDRPPAARPDLTEYLFDLNAKDVLSNSVQRGNSFQVEYNLLNSGFANTGSVSVDFYLSTNTTISTFDYYIGTVSFSDLAAYTFLNPLATLTVPSSVPLGAYYVGWIMNSAVAEYTTSNNAVVIANETLTVTPEPGPSITVLSPNGGELWRVGERRTISWSTNGVLGKVRIQISRNGGATWKNIAAGTPNDGVHPWRVTKPVTGNALIRVLSVDNLSILDVSNSSFTIQ